MNFTSRAIALLLPIFAAMSAAAAPSVLSLSDHRSDSLIIMPESVETDVHRLMENWYLRNYTALDTEVDRRPDVPVSDDELIRRLMALPTTIEMPFNSVVKSYINVYTGKKRSLVETMLGMSLYYLPIFEAALEKEQIPLELKYLPVIESAMNPDAVSKAGATGLWQIMIPTGKSLGLEINTLVDERRDPIRSSEAAAAYLRQLYDIYHDWSLAIAAYNCGPGNINKALRRCVEDKKDFWAIYPFLPQETRGYLPGFIAATYVMNYYNMHDISPALAKRPILTDTVHVNHRIHFQQIADILHLPIDELKILNPQYRQQIIPGDIKPYPLVLPANQIYAYVLSEELIAAHDADKYNRRSVVEPSTGEPATVNGQEGEWVTVDDVKWHKVARHETLSSIAKRYGVTVNSIKRNNGNVSKPRRGQSLKIVTTKRVFKPREDAEPEEAAPQPTTPAADDLLVANTPAESAPAEEVATPVTVAPNPQADALELQTAYATVEADTYTDTEVAETLTEVAAPDREVAEPSLPEPEKPAASEVGSKVSNSFRASQSKQKERSSRADKASGSKSSAQPRYHTVKKGESLYKIAQANGTTVDELKRLNNLSSNNIAIGKKLRIK